MQAHVEAKSTKNCKTNCLVTKQHNPHLRVFVIWKVVFDIGMVYLVFSINKLNQRLPLVFLVENCTLVLKKYAAGGKY